LEDEIFRLKKLNGDPALAQVLEEALEALHEGRELEAEALVEKAAALSRRA
jgi:hypothetical protein